MVGNKFEQGLLKISMVSEFDYKDDQNSVQRQIKLSFLVKWVIWGTVGKCQTLNENETTVKRYPCHNRDLFYDMNFDIHFIAPIKQLKRCIGARWSANVLTLITMKR